MPERAQCKVGDGLEQEVKGAVSRDLVHQKAISVGGSSVLSTTGS